MTRPTIRLALRNSDYLTPILLGDVKSPDCVVVIDCVFGNLIDNHATSAIYQGGEMSFSRDIQARDRGADDVVAVAHFRMRAFRHRCMITAKSSTLSTIAAPADADFDILLAGELDAVFTPFMPPGFYDADSQLRFLLPDFRAAEVDYFRQVGFVPGIHLLALQKPARLAHPGLPSAP